MLTSSHSLVDLPLGQRLTVRHLLDSGQARVEVEHGCYNALTQKYSTQYYLQLTNYPPIMGFFRHHLATAVGIKITERSQYVG